MISQGGGGGDPFQLCLNVHYTQPPQLKRVYHSTIHSDVDIVVVVVAHLALEVG